MPYEIKDEDNLVEHDSGVLRSDNSGKPNFGLIWPDVIPYEDQLLTRFAAHMTKAAAAKGARNWERAKTDTDLQRFKESAWRHFLQWISGQEDEDHAAALLFNIAGVELVRAKRLRQEPANQGGAEVGGDGSGRDIS